MLTEERSWNLDLFQVWFKKDAIQCIMVIPAPYPSEGQDKISWCHTSTGAFSVKSAYKILKDAWNSRDEKMEMHMEAPMTIEVHFFIWTVLQQRLLTNEKRVKRGLTVNPSWSICGLGSEDILHIFRDCITSKGV